MLLTQRLRKIHSSSTVAILKCYDYKSGLSSEAPESAVRTIEIHSGDCIVICTDGIHDLVSSKDWQLIDDKTDLQEWLKTLKDKVYESEGNAYDNGTALVVRFD